MTKWLGDGVMLSGVETSAVLECVTSVRRRGGVEGKLALRGGVCAGPVIMFEGDDYIGAAANAAAELCDAAVAGQVLAAADTAAAAPPGIEMRELHEIRAPGLSEPLAVNELTPPAAREVSPPPSGILDF